MRIMLVIGGYVYGTVGIFRLNGVGVGIFVGQCVIFC